MIIAGINGTLVEELSGLAAGFGTVLGIYVQQRRQNRQDRKQEDKEEAEAPAKDLTATGQAAEAIARAAAALILPFQETIANQQLELGRLREAVTVSREAEADCQRQVAALTTDLSACRSKLREVTDHLGIAPNGEDEGSKL